MSGLLSVKSGNSLRYARIVAPICERRKSVSCPITSGETAEKKSDKDIVVACVGQKAKKDRIPSRYSTNIHLLPYFWKHYFTNDLSTVVLVTGGTGFLGSTLIKQLIDSGIDVRATKRESSVIPSILENHPRLQWVNADMNDFFALSDAFEGVTKVYHCAAFISFHRADDSRMRQVNVEGTAHIVTLALEHRARLVYASSIAAVGRSKQGLETTEEDLWEYSNDKSAYSISKYEAEQEVWRGIAEGLDAVIVNPSLIIGRGAKTAGNGATGTIFAELQRGLDFYATGSVGLVDVVDVANAMVVLMEKTTITGERFLLNNANMSSKELLARCSTYLGRPAPRYKLTPFMLGIAWRTAWFSALFTGKRPALTREIAKSVSQKVQFSNRKVRAAIGITFRPVDDSLREVCGTLLTTSKT